MRIVDPIFSDQNTVDESKLERAHMKSCVSPYRYETPLPWCYDGHNIVRPMCKLPIVDSGWPGGVEE